ncbi:MAG: HypC/HybG/HupF family hydrogenase formation chaperone [Acidimicrobiia bacterium]|nr:HypC/HybG/HupF family hydrogenase formation chaperone [Acidimicrobiia bacterium]
MCLAVPGKVRSIDRRAGLRMGDVDFGGARKSICLDYTPDAGIGSYVIVHAGFAIAVLDEAAAAETLALLAQATAQSEGEAQ